jgi:predicted secreted protein
VIAVVGITDEDPDAALVAARVNESAAWALELAKKQKGVKVKSGAYHTYPISDKGRIRRWRASQEIIIEGADVVPIGELVAVLQARLQLRSLSFTITPERRREVEDALVAEGLAAFLARAVLVRKSLDVSSYEIVSISIDAGGGRPQPAFRQQAMVMMDSMSKRPAPALEAGTTRIRVSASGTIELD